MLRCFTTRIPAVLVNTVHHAVYRGSTYAILSLFAAWVGSFFEVRD